MSSGSQTFGTNYYGPLYHRKSWSGTDGKWTSGPGGVKLVKDNPYSVTYQRLRCKGSDTVPSRQLSGNYQVPHVWTANDEVALQSALVSAVKGHQFNLAVTSAESRESFKMIYSNIASLGHAMRSLRRGDLSSAARSLGVKGKHSSKLDKDDLAGRWLELQYGWLPLLNDVHEGANAFAALNNRVRTSTVVVRKSGRPFTWGGSSSPSNYQNQGIGRTHVKLIYRMTEDISTARSLGLLDPLTVAWELIPYSFVVDWFIPIGSYLENLNTIPKLTGRFIHSKYTHSPVSVKVLQNWIYYGGGKVDGESYRFDRTITSSLSTARPTFKPLDRIFTPGHFWNSLALCARFF